MTVGLIDEQDRPSPADRLRALAEHVLAAEGVPAAMACTVLLVDEPAMAELNRAHLGGEGATDVLAFPLDAPPDDGGDGADGDVPRLLGDVVLCPQVAARQARGDDARELEMLLVHGILHLLGYDHAEEAERRAMFGRTDELLAEFRRTSPPAPARDADDAR